MLIHIGREAKSSKGSSKGSINWIGILGDIIVDPYFFEIVESLHN